MANNKTGFDYYNVDTNRYQDIRIKRLKKDFKTAGIAVYDYILCEIYRVRGCFLAWDESTAFDVAEYFGLKETLVNEIVNYCAAVGLFDVGMYKEYHILTSIDIQRKWLKQTILVNFDVVPECFLLISKAEIPFYKTNKHPRLSERNFGLWKKISKVVFERDNFTCRYCGKRGGLLEVDHIDPISNGGADELYNLATACRKCNRQKKDKTVSEFLEWRNNHER